MALRPDIIKGIDDDKKIFVGGTGTLTPKSLYHYFCFFGDVDRTRVFTNSKGMPRGFAIVLFRSVKAVKSVLTYDKNHYIGKRQIFPKMLSENLEVRVNKIMEIPRSNKLYLGGITPATSDNDIMEFFSKYGRVVSIFTPFAVDRNKRQRYSFITFEHPASAEFILKNFRKVMINNVKIKINSVHHNLKNQTKDMGFHSEPVAAPHPPSVNHPYYECMRHWNIGNYTC